MRKSSQAPVSGSQAGSDVAAFHWQGECKTLQINKKPLQANSVYDSKHTFIPDVIISAISNNNSQVFFLFMALFISSIYLFMALFISSIWLSTNQVL